VRIEQRLDELDLVLPKAAKLPPGIRVSFSWVRVRGNHAFVSGHGALTPDGSPAGPFGKVATEVSLEKAQASARDTALSVLGSLKRSLGDLDRVTVWLMGRGDASLELQRGDRRRG
jgi:hypothetical protein